MLEAVRQLVTTAAAARDPQAFWQAAVQILSEQLPADRVRLDYRGLAESGSVEAGHGGGGTPLEIEWESADGRRVAATIVGPGGRVGLTELQATLEVI